MITRPLLLTLASVWAAGAYAATPAQAPKDTVNLAGITVTAPTKTNVALLPLNVSEITSQEIDKSAESSLLPVLQNKIPGLFVSERGFAGYGVSGGSAGEVNIRGVGQGNKVLFMIDGQPQWAGVFGHSVADTYVANGVERIEVVKGPSSLLYGSNAMGGSVNIITRRPDREGVFGRARALFGSFSTQKFNLATGLKRGKWSAMVAGQLDRSNGNRKGSEFWLANEYIQLRYEASQHWSVGANVDMTQSKANNPGTTVDPLEGMWTKISRGTASVYAKDSYGIANGGVQAFICWGRHKVDDGWKPGATPTDYLFNSTDYNMGFTLFQTLNLWTGNDLSLGVDFQHWGGHNWNTGKEDPSAVSSEFRNHVNEVAGYVMMQQAFFHDILSLNAGVRLQHGSTYGNEWVPQAGVIVRPVKGGEFKFSFGKGFRSPNLRELYLYKPANPDLKPEYMYNYEAGYRQRLLDSRLDMGVTFFFIDGKDMIQVQNIDGRPMNVNTGSFINKGFEVDASFRINRLWNVAANYGYLHTNNRQLLYAPKNKLGAEVTYSPHSFSFTLEDESVWSLRNGAPDNATTSYTLVNFRGSYTFNQSKAPVSLILKLDNIFNRRYEVVYGCPMPGFTILGGVEVKF